MATIYSSGPPMSSRHSFDTRRSEVTLCSGLLPNDVESWW